MERAKQAETLVKVGGAIFAGGLAGEVGAAVFKGDVVPAMMIMLMIIGLTMMLVGMIYGRVVDTVTCYCRRFSARCPCSSSPCRRS